MADTAPVGMEIVGRQAVFGVVGRVPRIGIPCRGTPPPVFAEIRPGMIAVNHVCEGGDHDAEIRLPGSLGRAHEERDPVLMLSTAQACRIDPAAAK